MEFLGCCAALPEHPPFGEDTCLCCQTDSTNAEGWLHKTSLCDVKVKIAFLTQTQWLGEYQIEPNYCLYSQWFEGKANVASDSLSLDHHLSDTELTTSQLLFHHPEQLPMNFPICPISPEMNFWVYLRLVLGRVGPPIGEPICDMASVLAAVCAIRLNGQADRVIRTVRITIRTRTVAIPQ
jgi:hypothetical protein